MLKLLYKPVATYRAAGGRAQRVADRELLAFPLPAASAGRASDQTQSLRRDFP